MQPDPGQAVVTAPPVVPALDALPAPEVGLEATEVDPHRQWLEATALLQVHAHGDGLVFIGLNAVCDPLEPDRDEPYAKPDLAPAGMAETGATKFPGRLRYLMEEWSQTHSAITAWINRLRRRFGDRLRLVIWDDASGGVPWELLWLDPVPADPAPDDPAPDDLAPDDAVPDGSLPGGSLPGGWLGALVSVTRWFTLRDDARNPYSDRPQHCHGRIVAHLDGVQRRREYATIRHYTLQPEDEIANLRKFLARVRDHASDPALIYMAAEGAHGDHLTSFRLGSQEIWELKGRFRALRQYNGVVFLNSCHSGVVLNDPQLNDGKLRGFAQLFLSEGAQGVIGTLGAVGDNNAFRVIAALAGTAGRDPVEVASVLRDLRAQAAREADERAEGDEADERDLWTFHDIFMYVYYGNPATTLQLTRNPTSA
ncbi:MAG TPA: hypothetical protein VH478_07145 [Trebonia sp.]|jgi:hypothetical protein|nr:hypothetical protein [Trebonia sp.]